MIDTDKYEGHTEGAWTVIGNGEIEAHYSIAQVLPFVSPKAFDATANLIADAPLLLAEVKRLREENDLLRSMQRDGIEASAHDNLLSEINRLREDNEKLHDAINRSFHAKISGSALEIYNGWWEGEEE